MELSCIRCQAKSSLKLQAIERSARTRRSAGRDQDCRSRRSCDDDVMVYVTCGRSESKQTKCSWTSSTSGGHDTCGSKGGREQTKFDLTEVISADKHGDLWTGLLDLGRHQHLARLLPFQQLQRRKLREKRLLLFWTHADRTRQL